MLKRILIGTLLPPLIVSGAIHLMMCLSAPASVPSDILLIALFGFAIAVVVGLVPCLIYSLVLEFLARKVISVKYGNYLFICISVLIGILWALVFHKIAEHNGVFDLFQDYGGLFALAGLITGWLILRESLKETVRNL
ncbi:hypothetical protein [Teredinibacter sp. KSP-S5-2]|uniref:hypothetical protein n=1 Tax=Teredinibacter sp. KSP-S5-2 TaxID=3034506 RepID=UPI0029345F62|nr:hypothetical protein [Teredinibacter sp. KSP-S5-2]WNO08442.1 hypothetical protein P5V12_15840 [Teredinibacter sp. KSP-S5-2]